MSMTPYEIRIHVYANSQAEADELQQAFRAFVIDKRNHGIAVTASKVTGVLKAFGNHPIVSNYLRYG